MMILEYFFEFHVVNLFITLFVIPPQVELKVDKYLKMVSIIDFTKMHSSGS